MLISIIVAVSKNGVIGKDNQLIWRLPDDLKRFKKLTTGHPIIMGRKTYESIGRLLPGRKNIIITRSPDYKLDGAEIYHSIEAAIASCNDEKIFIIGGAEIFKQTLPLISEVYRTVIQHSFEADAFFPEISAEFKMTWEECHSADEKNKYAFCFQKWERN